MIARRIASLVLLAMALLIVGCLETEYTLGPREASQVDRIYCGDWQLSRRNDIGQTENSLLIVRNLNDKEYYVEWIDTSKPVKEEDRSRNVAFVADVKGVSFAHLAPLDPDGNNPDKFIIFRFGMDGDKLVIKELNDKFFKEQGIDSNEKLRKVIEENLENNQMYSGEPMVGTRQTK